MVDLSQMERRLRDVSGGLVEVVSVPSQRESERRADKEKVERLRGAEGCEDEGSEVVGSEEDEEDEGECLVQLIHQSVKEFLLKKYLPGEHSSESWITEIRSHFHLEQACVTYLALSDFDTSKPACDIPFFRYAAMHWIKHATLADVSGLFDIWRTSPSLEHDISTVGWHFSQKIISRDNLTEARRPLWKLPHTADVKYFLEQESTACMEIVQPNARTLQNNKNTIQRQGYGIGQVGFPGRLQDDSTVYRSPHRFGLNTAIEEKCIVRCGQWRPFPRYKTTHRGWRRREPPVPPFSRPV